MSSLKKNLLFLFVFVLTWSSCTQKEDYDVLQKISGNNQRIFANKTLASPIRARLVDYKGNPIRNASISFSVLSGGGFISDSIAVTDYLGYVETEWTLGSADNQELNVSVQNVSGRNIINSPQVYTAKIIPQPITGTLVDSRDGQIYPTVNYSGQVWMAQNLNYYLADSSYVDPAFPSTSYGRLYEWSAAKIACPIGWHLPTDSEWKDLEIYLGMTIYEADTLGFRGEELGKWLKLDSSRDWDDNGEGNNYSLFTALPAGVGDYLIHYHRFAGLWFQASFWTASEVDSDLAWHRTLASNESNIFRHWAKKKNAYSCRCVKD